MLLDNGELLNNSLGGIPTGDRYGVFFVPKGGEAMRQTSGFQRGLVLLSLAAVNQMQLPQIVGASRSQRRSTMRKARFQYQVKEEAAEGSRE
jgi:hypothetical protein